MSGFRPTRPETGSLRADWFASTRSADESGHRFRIETQRRHETLRRSQSDKIVIGDFSRGRAALLIRPSMGQSLCQAGDCHTRVSSAVSDRLNDFRGQARQDGQAPDMTFGEAFARGDLVE
jgi:hypothetical protein